MEARVKQWVLGRLSQACVPRGPHTQKEDLVSKATAALGRAGGQAVSGAGTSVNFRWLPRIPWESKLWFLRFPSRIWSLIMRRMDRW